jgi:HSP20 family protein
MLTRWEPWADMWSRMTRLQETMNRLFGEPSLDDNRYMRLGGAYPALDLWEDESTLFVEAELPGMELDDLEIFVTGGNQLTIRGERKQPQLEQGTWHRQERGFGQFSRVVTLPLNVEADQVEAKLQHGVLTISLPKAAEAKPRRIEVKAN